MTRFLDEGCAQGGLTPAFIDYYRAEITHEWAKLVVSYPFNYMFANGNENEGPRAVPADYHDPLDQVELVDEAAIGTTHYRTFLGRNFLRLKMEAYDRVQLEQLSDSQRQDLLQPIPATTKKQALHGKVPKISSSIHPEYTEVVEEVIRESIQARALGSEIRNLAPVHKPHLQERRFSWHRPRPASPPR